MIVTVLTPEITSTIENLNRRGTWQIHAVSGKTISEILKTIENGGTYTHAVVDIEAIHANIDAAIDLIDRLHKTTTAEIIVIC